MKPCIGCGKVPTCYHAACSTVYCVDCINGILDAVHRMSPQGVESLVQAVKVASVLLANPSDPHLGFTAASCMKRAVSQLPREE